MLVLMWEALKPWMRWSAVFKKVWSSTGWRYERSDPLSSAFVWLPGLQWATSATNHGCNAMHRFWYGRPESGLWVLQLRHGSMHAQPNLTAWTVEITCHKHLTSMRTMYTVKYFWTMLKKGSSVAGHVRDDPADDKTWLQPNSCATNHLIYS